MVIDPGGLYRIVRTIDGGIVRGFTLKPLKAKAF
jgi:hypothetical protein